MYMRKTRNKKSQSCDIFHVIA